MLWDLYEGVMGDLEILSGMLILICTNFLKSIPRSRSYMTTINVSIPYLLVVNDWVNPLGFQGYQRLIVSFFFFIFFILLYKKGFCDPLIVNFPSMFQPNSWIKPSWILTMAPLIHFKAIGGNIVEACDECAYLFHQVS